MYSDLIQEAARIFMDRKTSSKKESGSIPSLKPASVKKVRDRSLSYTHSHRGNWFIPEYDFDEIQIVQDVDSYVFRATSRKVNRFITAGWDFVGEDAETVDYIKQRIKYMEMATNRPFFDLMYMTVQDIVRFSNCLWVKARNDSASPGNLRTDIHGVQIEPVAGYFVIPFETVEFKTKSNGELKKVMQRLPDGEKREFSPRDTIHFYTHRKPGFSVGTPELFPALDDIALLRRIEENVEELIETVLFPVFHYKVGSEKFPERFGPDGEKETDIVKRTIEYMPAGGVYVSDHRHQIEVVGAESHALRIDTFLSYFKNRVMAALGTSSVDMGEGATANRSTASTMSKGMMMDIEAVQCMLKEFIEFYVINELLLEGGYNPLDSAQMVHMKFGVIDKEERRADENQQIQLYHGNIRTIDEVRASLGDAPFVDETMMDRTFFKRNQEPLALLKSAMPGSAASLALAAAPSSAITPEGVEGEKTFSQSGGQSGEKGNALGEGSTRSSQSKSTPSNQHGVRSGPKTNRDLTGESFRTTISYEDGSEYHLVLDYLPSKDSLVDFTESVHVLYEDLRGHGISFGTIVENQLPRLAERNKK
jgi:hypothetical protein